MSDMSGTVTGQHCQQTLKQIIDYFTSKSIVVPKQWIINSMSGMRDNQNPQNMYQLWLNTDLRSIPDQTPQLPNDINEIKTDERNKTALKTTMNGKFALQINSIVDISKPKQLSMTDSVDDDVLEDKSDGSEGESKTDMFKRKKQTTKKQTKTRAIGARVLSMMLTDGIIQCQAIEYKPIPCLTVETPIGAKILLSGPIDIYGAVLMLDSSHISLLGGQLIK